MAAVVLAFVTFPEIHMYTSGMCVCDTCVLASRARRLCPGWGSVRKFDADGNEDLIFCWSLLTSE